MVRFRSTALGRKALSDVRWLARLARFSPVPMLLALTLTSGCAGLSHSPGQIAAEDNDAQFSQAMRMAESVRANGDMSAAAVFYRRAHSLAPDQLEPIIGLAQSAAAVGAKEQALQFYRKAVVLAPDNIQARLGVGRVLLAMERPDLAAPELRAAIAAQPGDYRAYVALGVALDLSCEQRQAQQVYREGLLHDSGNMSLRNNLALSLAFSGDTGEAMDMLSELSRELGAGPRVRQNLALVYSLAGRPQDAAELARRDFSGARLRHNLALYESLRGVDGPRLAADVVCGSGDAAVIPSNGGGDIGAPTRSRHIAEAERRAISVAARSDASSWRMADSGAVDAIKTGHVGATKARPAADAADLTDLRDAQITDGSPAEASVVTYTVRPGDTLSLIAKKYYGNGRKYVALLEANSSRLAHPDKIYPGMVVNIPAVG